MRNVRKLFLSVAAAMAAVAFAASTAYAQTVEVSQEDGGHCGSVTLVEHVPTGGCSLKAVWTQPTVLVRHIAGVGEVEFSQCGISFEMRINEDGHGYIYNQVFTVNGGSCGRESCDEVAPHHDLPWEAQFREPFGGLDQEILRVTFCLAAFDPGPAEGQTGTSCTVDITVTHFEHAMEFSTPHFNLDHRGGAPCINLGGVVELTGHWVTQPSVFHPNSIEIHHLDDEPPKRNKATRAPAQSAAARALT
jgi:hypothetical protein